MQTVTRADAIVRGLTRYYTGKPCKRGHVAERIVSGFYCVECNCERQKSWNRENPEKRRAIKQRCDERPEARARERIKDRKRSKTQAFRATRRKHYARNADKIRAEVKAWRRKNRHKKRVTDGNRKARKKNAPGRYTSHDIERLMFLQGGKCRYCPAKLARGYHVDHKKPLVRGGTNWPRNLQLTCPTCNLKKHAMTHAEFLRALKCEAA